MNRLADSLLLPFALAACGLVVGGWLIVKGCREMTAALSLPNKNGVLR